MKQWVVTVCNTDISDRTIDIVTEGCVLISLWKEAYLFPEWINSSGFCHIFLKHNFIIFGLFG